MVIQAYILLKVSSGTERMVCEKIVNFDAVLTAGIIYGEYDIIAKVTLPDLQLLEEFLSEKIRTLPSIILTSTLIQAQEYKKKIT